VKHCSGGGLIRDARQGQRPFAKLIHSWSWSRLVYPLTCR
jgi:hypothetical protein